MTGNALHAQVPTSRQTTQQQLDRPRPPAPGAEEDVDEPGQTKAISRATPTGPRIWRGVGSEQRNDRFFGELEREGASPGRVFFGRRTYRDPNPALKVARRGLPENAILSGRPAGCLPVRSLAPPLPQADSSERGPDP